MRKQARFFREGGRLQRVFAICVMGLLLVLALIGLVVSADDLDVGVVVVSAVFIVVAGLAYWGIDRLWRWRSQLRLPAIEREMESGEPQPNVPPKVR